MRFNRTQNSLRFSQNLKECQHPAITDKKRAFAVGISAIDTSDPSGPNQKEILLGKTAEGGGGELGTRDRVVSFHASVHRIRSVSRGLIAVDGDS